MSERRIIEMKTDKKYASVFELNGVPKLSQAFPLALQHVVAMIVGCVTPAIVIAGVAGLEGNDKVILCRQRCSLQQFLH